MQNSKMLFAERKKLADKQSELMAEDKADEALVVEGQIKQLDITLEHVLDEEEKLRANARVQNPAQTLAEAVLGPRDEFTELQEGFRADAANPSVVTVPAPVEYETDIPGKSPALLQDFAATLPSVAAAGSVNFLQRQPQQGEPETWAGVVDGESAEKAKVVYKWEPAVANKETIAGYVPVSKDTLMDYDELSSIIQSDLRIDLSDKKSSKFLKGNNNAGIIGVQNTPGVMMYTPPAGAVPGGTGSDKAAAYYEAIRRMRSQMMAQARRIPTHVCMNPDVKTELDLHKTNDGFYQFLGDMVLWGMQVVEDVNCDGILVYDAYAAKARPVHNITVTVGTINDQLIRNELCILMEETAALQVTYPDAFCQATNAALGIA